MSATHASLMQPKQSMTEKLQANTRIAGGAFLSTQDGPSGAPGALFVLLPNESWPQLFGRLGLYSILQCLYLAYPGRGSKCNAIADVYTGEELEGRAKVT